MTLNSDDLPPLNEVEDEIQAEINALAGDQKKAARSELLAAFHSAVFAPEDPDEI